MGNCCYCCLDEGAKVGKILGNFQSVPVSGALDGQLAKVVGRVMLAGAQPFFSPASGRPCVYYEVCIQEEIVTRSQDAEGNMRENTHWQECASQTQYCDFYLQDGKSQVFVNGAQRGQCKIQSEDDNRGWNEFYLRNLPVGLKMMVLAENPGWQWVGATKYRYSEKMFEINELVAGFGVIYTNNNPYTGQQIRSLVPYRADTLNDQYFIDNQWDDFSVKAWQEFAQKGPTVLLSDKPDFTGGIMIPIIPYQPPVVNWQQNAYQFQAGWQSQQPRAQVVVIQAPQ